MIYRIKNKKLKKNNCQLSIVNCQLLILLVASFFVACTQDNLVDFDRNESSGYELNFIETCYSSNADSIYHRFNILNKSTNNKEFLGDIRLNEIETVTTDSDITVEGIRKLLLSGGEIPSDIVVSILVDRSVHTEDMYSIRNAVRYIVDNLPPNTVYISFFDAQTGQSRRITADNFELFDDQFRATTNNKIIFDAALAKFQELCGVRQLASDDVQFTSKINDENVKKVLVLLTDGRVDANNQRTAENIQRFSDAVQQLDDDPTNKHRVEIHAIRYGERNDDVDFTLTYLCVDIRNSNVRGGYYFADPVAFIENLKESDNTIPDYEIVMSNPAGKIYHGQVFYTGVTMMKTGMTITGKVRYVVGSLLTPLQTGSKNIILQVVFGLVAGLLLLGFGFLFMQMVIPFFRFKTENFNRKYVRIYSFDNDTAVKCHYCLSEIRDGDEIVTKCHHTVHKHCWIENGCKCTDYGRNCKHGKQFLYDTGLPFSATNRPYYTHWAMYGMAGGLLAWLIFHTVMYFFPGIFGDLIQGLLSVFKDIGGVRNLNVFTALYPKISDLLLFGLLAGFILVLFFSVLNKFRQRKKDSILLILLRSMAGAVFGFVSSLLGAVIFILCNTDATNIFTDWIPWILSGCAMGAVLFFRTNTVIKHILPGLMLSGILCFLILLTGGVFGFYAVVFGLMIFGGGAGIAFISARKIIHRYYLKFKGDKEEKIAIHKWMSVAGGSNEVSIGSSPDATIRMTWDTHPSIKDIHVRLFFDKKNRLPCIKILSTDVTYNGVFAKNNEEYLLKNGVRFTIGNTVYQYIEKY